jgi:hypothetical protein
MQRWASKLFLKICISQIRKFLGSFQKRKITNVLGMPVRKSEIRKFLNIAQLCLKPVLNMRYLSGEKVFYHKKLGPQIAIP